MGRCPLHVLWFDIPKAWIQLGKSCDQGSCSHMDIPRRRHYKDIRTALLFQSLACSQIEMGSEKPTNQPAFSNIFTVSSHSKHSILIWTSTGHGLLWLLHSPGKKAMTAELEQPVSTYLVTTISYISGQFWCDSLSVVGLSRNFRCSFVPLLTIHLPFSVIVILALLHCIWAECTVCDHFSTHIYHLV